MKRSMILTDRLDPGILLVLTMKRQVLHRERAHLKVPGCSLVLTLNCFSFAGNYYKQINGVAMGTRMGPSYANLFVGYVEHQFLISTTAPNLNSTAATSSTASELFHLAEKNSINL